MDTKTRTITARVTPDVYEMLMALKTRTEEDVKVRITISGEIEKLIRDAYDAYDAKKA